MTEAVVALNVNDDDATRYLVSRMLRQGGFTVVEAACGREALEAARRRPALIVLDIKLPDISGLEVCRLLKADPLTRDIPVLQTSATFVTTERRVAGLESGADAYLAQPIEPVELVATAHALLRTQRAEREVEEIGREWKKTFDVIADGIALVALDMRIVRCNRAMADFCQTDAASLTGRHLSASVPDYGETLVDAATGAARDRKRVVAEALVRRQLLRVVADPMFDAEGNPERVVLQVADITEHRQLEEDHRQRAIELAEAGRRKDEFLGMLAHELRNPLHALAASISLMDRVGLQDERNIKLRNAARRQTHHLGRLVDDLLEVSRITRGKVQLQRLPCDLRVTLQGAAEHARSLFDARGQKLQIELPDDPLPMNADALRLEQVFVNLLHNASKYSEPGTDATLACRVEKLPGGGTAAVVTVTDQGVGIPASHLTSIFEPFVQVDQSLARSLGGLGIGLTISRTLAELHGGAIAATSAGEGRGSTFTVTLPLDQATPPATVRPEEPDLAAARSRPRTILLVEDNPDSREVLAAWLGELGHTVHTAGTGTEAIAAARTTRPEVVLLDIGLPGMDGYQVAQALREMPEARDAMIVAITGYGRPEDNIRAREAGFDGHLIKPVQPDALARLIHMPRQLVRSLLTQRRTS